MVSNVILGILMSQNFQFMKINIVNINPKAVAIIFYQHKLSVLPLWRHVEPSLVCTYITDDKKQFIVTIKFGSFFFIICDKSCLTFSAKENVFSLRLLLTF